MELQLPKYVPSGRVRPTAIVALIGTLVAGVLVAWVYQALVRWIPFIILKAFAVVGFGFAIGMLSMMTVSIGHVRNRMVGVLLGALVATGSLAGSYGWAYMGTVNDVVGAEEYAGAITRDEVLAQYSFQQYVADRVEIGWSVGKVARSSSLPLNGGVVYVIWGIEALLMLGAGVLMAYGSSDAPYCEDCKQWTKETTKKVPGRTRDEVMSLLQSNQLGHLVTLAPPENADPKQWITLKAHACPNCARTYLSVSESKETTGKDGKAEVSSNSIAEHLELAPRQATELRAQVSGQAAEQKAA
jgi:hypothetical protein